MEVLVTDQPYNHIFKLENGEIDPTFMGKVLPKLVPKLMEVLQDPAVIDEITQNQNNHRQPEQNTNPPQVWQAPYDQNLQYSINKSTHDNFHANIEAGRLLQHPDPDNDDDEDYKSCSSSTTSRNKINSDLQQTSSKYIRKKRFAYGCIISAVFLLAIILAGSLTVFFLWLAVNSGSILILDQLYNACSGILNVSVKSLDEYNAAFEIAGKQKLSIDIELDRPNDWPTGVQLHSSNSINDIRINGPFHAMKLKTLLSTISKLEKLHLDNRNNLMCSESIPPIKTFDGSSTVNITVKQLILERFNPACTKALDIMHESIQFHKIEAFRFISGTLTTENVELFEKLLEKYKGTLKRLEVLDSSLGAEIFSGKHSFTLDYVKEVVLETLQNNTNTVFTPLHNICKIFPNIQRLSFGSGFTEWNDIKNVYDCKQLKSLQVKIWVQPSSDDVSLSFLSEQFPNLEGAEVAFLFGNTLASSEMICSDEIRKIYGRKYLPKLLLANLRITSNCKLRFY